MSKMSKLVRNLLMEYESLLANFPGRILTVEEGARGFEIDRDLRRLIGNAFAEKEMNKIFDRVILKKHLH